MSKGASPADVRRAAERQLASDKRHHPSLFFIPNVGQDRVFDVFRRPPTEIPFITVFGAGNGTGKTAALAIFAVGCVFGREELDPDWFSNVTVFDWLHEKWMKRGEHRPLRGRIVCKADSMKEGGPVLQAIRAWFPAKRYKLNKNSKSFYNEIVCDNGCVIDVRTTDQDEGSHAGSNLDFILTDEPFEEKFYPEMVGRLRDQGFMALFLTPLDVAGWMLDDIVDQADGKRIAIINASIWENCSDWSPDPLMWSGRKIGVGKVLTRGLLDKRSIDNMIIEWSKKGRHELDARVEGKFSHLRGAIYTTFNRDAHVIEPFPIPDEWPIYCIIDPHDAKPPAIIWIAQSPVGAYIIREWPISDYLKMENTHLTLEQVTSNMRDIEAPYSQQVLWRFMDPNKGLFKHMTATSQSTVQQEYAELGYHFDLADDNLEVGHDKVRKMLYYDEKQPVDGANIPYLRIFSTCTNVITALSRYGFKRNASPEQSVTSRVEKKYKDFADGVRYFAGKVQRYQPVDVVGHFSEILFSGRVRK